MNCLGIFALASSLVTVPAQPVQPVQLCSCDASSTTQSWSWGAPGPANGGGGMATALSVVRLKLAPDRCLFMGGVPGKPSYLTVQGCNSTARTPVKLRFRAQHNVALTRDLAVLTDGAAPPKSSKCMDADAMSAHLQLFDCIEGDDDQQYLGIESYGLIVDQWTGYGNCVGVAGPSCKPPKGTGANPNPNPRPAPAVGANSTRMSPRYHLNDGGWHLQDPSGCISINGTWFVFPDGSHSALYTSTDLVRWERRTTNIQFGETGGIGITETGRAVTFGGGFKFADLETDPWLADWKAGELVPDGDPHQAHGMGGKNVFRNGDPSRPFKFEDNWYIVLGAGKNATGDLPGQTKATPTPGCPLCDNPWMQGELRLYKASSPALTDWTFVNVLFATNETAGRMLDATDTAWASQMRDCPTCPLHSVSNMFECPDFFPIGPDGKWMFVTSKILQGHQWATGGQHHWDEYYIGNFNGSAFTPEQHGVLDYGYVAAGKTGGNDANDPMGRRVFFGWNMPWSRQGRYPNEGPWRRRRQAGAEAAAAASATDPVRWPDPMPFGGQVLPRDLSLFPDGTLRMAPVPELATLRNGHHYHYPSGVSAPQATARQPSAACVGPIKGTQLELDFTVHGPSDEAVSASGVWASVTVLASPDGRERTLIGANATHLILNQLNSTLTPDLTPEELSKVVLPGGWYKSFVSNRTVLHAPLPPNRVSHTIHAFLDGYNLEVFADDRVAITTNLFPTLEESVCVGVAAGAGGGTITSLDVYGLSPAPVTGVPVSP